jgi:hypothetical protein
MYSQRVYHAKDVSIPVTELDTNVLWSKVMYRIIMLDDEKYSVTTVGSKELLVQKIIESVKLGNDTAYLRNEKLEPYMMDSLKLVCYNQETSLFEYRKLEYSDVSSIEIIENWYFLKKENKLVKETVAICLRVNSSLMANGCQTTHPIRGYDQFISFRPVIFWIY